MSARIPSIRSPHAAFTLVELLVVIAIIGILMGLLLTAISGAKDAGRRSQAGTEVRNIASACKNYYTDYGKFPPYAAAEDPTGTPNYYSYGDTTAVGGNCKRSNVDLFDILRAIDTNATSPARVSNPLHALNKRQQKYYEGQVAKDPTTPRAGFADSTQFAAAVQGALFDPWGEQYCILLDATGNDTIDMSAAVKTFYSDVGVVRSSVVVFSLGKDGVRGNKGVSPVKLRPSATIPADDIVSFQ